MNNYNFNEIPNRKFKGTIKWDVEHINKRFKTSLTTDDDFYPMFIADSDFRLPDEILIKMHERYLVPDFGYFDIKDGFYQSIINWYKNKHDTKLEKEWIVPASGTVTSLYILSKIYGESKNFLVLTPAYRQFKACAAVGKLYTLALKYKNQEYSIDFEELERTFKDQEINILIFCNPHNPSGRSWTKDELTKLVELCRKYSVILIADEIHSDIVLSKRSFYSLINFDNYDNIVVATSPNKTFSVSGLSTSYLLTRNPKIREAYIEYTNNMHLSPNRVGAEMLEIVYNYGQDWHNDLQKTIKANVQTTIEYLEPLGIEVMKPDAGYLVWIKIDSKLNVDEFITKLAQEESVLLETGSRFIADYAGFIRINVATSPAIVKEAMQSIKKVYLEFNR